MKKYYSLIDKIYNKNNIFEAFKLVKKNKGAPGIDGETVQNFECLLDEKINEIHCELKNGDYKLDLRTVKFNIFKNIAKDIFF